MELVKYYLSKGVKLSDENSLVISLELYHQEVFQELLKAGALVKSVKVKFFQPFIVNPLFATYCKVHNFCPIFCFFTTH